MAWPIPALLRCLATDATRGVVAFVRAVLRTEPRLSAGDRERLEELLCTLTAEAEPEPASVPQEASHGFTGTVLAEWSIPIHVGAV
jgi:hypothetical protein